MTRKFQDKDIILCEIALGILFSMPFLSGAFLRVDYSHGFVSVFFLVGAFSLKKKSPTIIVGSYFSAYNLTLNGPLFLQFSQFLAYEVVLLHHLRNSTGSKGTPLEYFRLCETLFSKKKSPKGSLSVFRYCEAFFQFFFIKGSPMHHYFDILKSFCYF